MAKNPTPTSWLIKRCSMAFVRDYMPRYRNWNSASRLEQRNADVKNEVKRVKQHHTHALKIVNDGRVVPLLSPDQSRYAVVVTLHSSFRRRRFEWEIWDTQEARPLQSSYKRFLTLREAAAAGSVVLAQRWVVFHPNGLATPSDEHPETETAWSGESTACTKRCNDDR